ncbi:MAG: hypothetical protein M1836_003232 [Candelina mexicana]|nr:MAG: hypothetical protein M1836_003232 [Candelina mexicana]
MLHRAKSKDLAPRSTASGPSFMDKGQVADYLTELRSNRVARPNGSRPQPSNGLPSRSITPALTQSSSSPAESLSSISQLYAARNENPLSGPKDHARSSSVKSHQRSQSDTPVAASLASAGRPIVQAPSSGTAFRDFPTSTSSSVIQPSGSYRESDQRRMERQEARSLRNALQNMDLQEESRLHSSAQDEAAELVWRHQHPDLVPKDPHIPYNYNQHLGGGNCSRGRNIARESRKETDDDQVRKASKGTSPTESLPKRSDSSGTQKSKLSNELLGITAAQTDGAVVSIRGDSVQNTGCLAPDMQTYEELAFPAPPLEHSSRRRSSRSRSRKASGEAGKGLFRNPDDHIYEEPEEDLALPVQSVILSPPMPAPLKLKPRNPLSRVQMTREPLPRVNTAPEPETKTLSRFEIHRNPPSQSRNPGYVSNRLPPTPPDSARTSEFGDSKDSRVALGKDEVEIRSEDIRAATSMRLKDRSPKLPTPTIVSNKPGRPIVSFALSTASKDSNLEQGRPMTPDSPAPAELGNKLRSLSSVPVKANDQREASSTPDIPTIDASETPPIPTINLPDEPSIPVMKPSVPTKNAPSPRSARGSATRPLPNPKSKLTRPLPYHSATAPAASTKAHWSPSVRRPTATCAQCALPIEGRIVSAASQRFHPECFICFHCGEGLECVAFYPEPDNERAERVSRIQRRANGEAVEEVKGQGAIEDGDEALRFYCHLDFHEFFSPRCRNCKTPIEGEVVVACGGEWHVGHFFCAECGDPFDSSTPFVEKEGYAWCINCHTNRFSNKCKKCRRPVTDMVLKALGAEWHAQCFCCVECGDQFNDGRYFLRGDSEDPVCVKCEERRLKA